MTTPRVTMLSYFFNPMSFLTAIMQSHSVQHGFELDKMTLAADVLKRRLIKWILPLAKVLMLLSRYGSARWDNSSGAIEDSRMKELYPKMPVITIRAVMQSKLERMICTNVQSTRLNLADLVT